ncbi:MAG: branched-chain amino acid ABC transporter permease [Rhodospirillaceae bacterium]|nr:branched-chain amino acid ABC transporter permease [Rhodospirillaceae bacterium]
MSDLASRSAAPSGADRAAGARRGWRPWRLLARLNGPQTLGRGPAFWGGFVIVCMLVGIYPLFSDGWTVGNTAYFFTWTFMAMGLCVIWGYAGALSFGQTAFFGLSGYAYGVLTLNIGSAYGFTFLALAIGVGMSALLALLLGYFLFYGRISGVFLGIVTLSVTLVFETFMAQTAGPEWTIGSARLNGFNGMTGMPPLTLPWFDGELVLWPDIPLYYLLMGMVIVCYLALRIFVNSRFGNVLVAIRENPDRAETLGYDIRRYQLGAFIVGSSLAGLSGVLYTAWGQYITPNSMGLYAAALPIVWVAVGGRSDLTATLIGTLAVLWVFQTLTIYGSQYALVVMGALLLVTVLFAPRGLVLGLVDLAGWASGRLRRNGPASGQEDA